VVDASLCGQGATFARKPEMPSPPHPTNPWSVRDPLTSTSPHRSSLLSPQPGSIGFGFPALNGLAQAGMASDAGRMDHFFFSR